MLLKIKKDKQGFTLIEVLVSIAIISIIICSFFTIVNSSVKQNSKNEKDIKSLNIAQSELESLRREIKSSTNKIIIYKQDGTELIKISDEKEENNKEEEHPIEWESDGNIKVESNSKYAQYIKQDNGKKIIQYNRKIDEDPTNYIVKLDLSRKKKAKKYLYTININVKAEGSLSKKETLLSTSILSK